MRIIFAGTPEFALPSLSALHSAGHEIAAVYTQPDRPAGRGRQLRASCIKQYALAHDLNVEQPVRLDAVAQQRLAEYQPEVMVVVAYGLILPQAVLNIPTRGCINVHASLLPRWRGAAPIARAILAGDTQSGVTIMQMDVGLDTGAMLASAAYPIDEQTTSASLHDALAQLGANLLGETLNQLDQITPITQPEQGVCYAHKLEKSEATIDWQLNAKQLLKQVNGFNPWPVAHTHTNTGEVLRIWQASVLDEQTNANPGTLLAITNQGIDVACGQGILRLLHMQLPGGKPLSAAQLQNAPRPWLAVGKRLGE